MDPQRTLTPETPDGSTTSVIYFDEDGDTQLLLNPDSDERIIVVSWKAMSLVSSAWKVMLNPNSPFNEGTRADRVIPLPDDDPEGLAILLNIAHFRFERVPTVLTFHGLLHVAILTEKYRATKMVRPWVRGWLDAAQSWIEEPGYEELLFVAWAFGDEEMFETIVLRLVRQVSINKEGQYATPAGRILHPCNDIDFFPPEIIDSILKTRLRTIRRLLEYPYQRVDECLKSNKTSRNYCCTFAKEAHSKDAARCDAVCFGSLIFALQRRGLDLQKTDATEIYDSVESLSKSLGDIVVCGLGNTQEQYSLGVCEHSYCTKNKYFRLFAEAHVKNIRSFVPESHQRHMKQKRAELYDKQSAHRKRQMSQEPTASKRKFSRLDADE